MEELKGKRYNHWTVVAEAPRRGSRRYWQCVCACGRKRDVLQYALTSGESKSCGCRSGKDLSGERYGKLVAVSPVIRGDGIRVWLCRCDCGAEPLVRARDLKSGATMSCGCARKDGRRYRLSLTAAQLQSLWDCVPESERDLRRALEPLIRRYCGLR